MGKAESDGNKQFRCEQCAGEMSFSPGSHTQACSYCGHENHIEVADEEVRELDFHAYLSSVQADEDTYEPVTVHCDGCGATTTLEDNVVSEDCPYCGSNLVHEGGSEKLIKPKSLLPFHVTHDNAQESFKTWLKSLWFAPNALKKRARAENKMAGVYVPYWTYDCQAYTHYRGERGDYYHVTETYRTTVNGKSVTRTRQKRKTRWTHVSGSVWDRFDDVLVLASRSLPKRYTEKLEPWDLQNLVPYQDDYLSGFRAESYQVDLEEGFVEAKEVMHEKIVSTIHRDIGGDRQRIHSTTTRHDDLTFKHILLPVWVSAYRYADKSYRFLINARTAEVQGERPYSWIKITLAILFVIAVIIGIIAATHS